MSHCYMDSHFQLRYDDCDRNDVHLSCFTFMYKFIWLRTRTSMLIGMFSLRWLSSCACPIQFTQNLNDVTQVAHVRVTNCEKECFDVSIKTHKRAPERPSSFVNTIFRSNGNIPLAFIFRSTPQFWAFNKIAKEIDANQSEYFLLQNQHLQMICINIDWTNRQSPPPNAAQCQFQKIQFKLTSFEYLFFNFHLTPDVANGFWSIRWFIIIIFHVNLRKK